jgi:uncharacterized membrane protein
MTETVTVLMWATALGCGLVAGVFFAFSTFVMAGLRRLPAGAGLAAMRSINVTAVTPAFMTLLFGTAAAGLALAATGLTERHVAYVPWAVASAAVYLVGVVGMTAGFHVPRNDALARLDPDGADATGAWRHYARVWTAGNHVRTVAALVSAALLAGGHGAS